MLRHHAGPPVRDLGDRAGLTVLEKMRQAATEQAKRAAEAAQRTAISATDRAGEAAAKGIDKAVDVAKDPATHARAKLAARDAAKATAKGAGKAAEGVGRAAKSALDKLNPDLLAAVVIKATSIQEQANAVLRRNRSLYRIGGIEIGAAFPPSISFQIIRAAELELEEEAMGILPEPGIASADLEAEGLADALEEDGTARLEAEQPEAGVAEAEDLEAEQPEG
jgi:hypothetical protein